jgi:hypothetical protein
MEDVGDYKYCPRIYLKEMRKNTKNLSLNCLYPEWGSNRKLPEYKSRELQLHHPAQHGDYEDDFNEIYNCSYNLMLHDNPFLTIFANLRYWTVMNQNKIYHVF